MCDRVAAHRVRQWGFLRDLASEAQIFGAPCRHGVTIAAGSGLSASSTANSGATVTPMTHDLQNDTEERHVICT